MNRYCHCYTPKQVTKHIHVCRKCGKQIYQQDVLSWKTVAIIILLLAYNLVTLAWMQQHWGTTP